MGRRENNETADNEDTEQPKGGRPGPVDGGGSGGMATRENASDDDETSSKT